MKETIEEHFGVEIPTRDTLVKTDAPRAWVVREFRELADRLESGELYGARIEWREGSAACIVEAFPGSVTIGGELKRWAVRLTRVAFEALSKTDLHLVKDGD